MARILCLGGALLWTMPAVALDLPAWLNFGSQAQEQSAPRPVVTEIVEDRGEAARWVPGVVQSRTQVTMAFQTLGRMVVRNAELGDRVRTGQVLAELATEDMAATTRAAQAAVDAAEVQLSTARTTLQRTEALAARMSPRTRSLNRPNRRRLPPPLPPNRPGQNWSGRRIRKTTPR